MQGSCVAAALTACRKSQCHSEAAKRPWESVLLKVPVFLKVWLKAEHLGERIATPVCELKVATLFGHFSPKINDSYATSGTR